MLLTDPALKSYLAKRNLNNNNMKYHLIGIGGVGMSGLAKLLIESGNEITGCDLKKFPISNFQFPNKSQISKSKFQIYIGHSPNHITKDLDGVIVTVAALHKSSPAKEEIETAKKMGVPIIRMRQMVNKLMSKPGIVGIAVSGMHGKTTTSSMIATILEKAGFDQTILIGGEVRNIGTSAKLGSHFAKASRDKQYFIHEACEYERQFLDIRPKIAVITNIEEEHLDTYPGGMKDIKQAFKKFIKSLPKDGLLVVWQEDKNLMPLTKAAKCKVKRVSLNKPWPGLKLKIPGRHVLLDATFAARVAHEIGIPSKVIQEALNSYKGAKRRFEIKGTKNGVTIVDDYGHHPTEIKATIEAAKEYLNQKPKTKNQKLIVVFQPHQYLRTKMLFKDFVTAFDGVDKLLITDIYLISGREPKEARADFSKDLAEAIKKRGVDVEYISNSDNYCAIAKRLKAIAEFGDLVLTLGATDIYKVGEQFLI